MVTSNCFDHPIKDTRALQRVDGHQLVGHLSYGKVHVH